MDDAYARLSLLAGVFAASADRELGREYFVRIIRHHSWDLTEEKLAAWKAEAIAMGVPPKALELSEKQKKEIPQLIALGRQMQDKVDRGQ